MIFRLCLAKHGVWVHNVRKRTLEVRVGMDIITSSNGMDLICRQTDAGVTILRVCTAGSRVALPETLFDRPVTAIGDRAFAPHADEGAPDHRKIRSITLPATLERVGDYAFYNCSGLEEIILTDRTRIWGGSCLMNCRSLRRIDLTVSDETSPTLCYFADELMGELDVTLRYEDGQMARLIFPEYIESYEDNKPAHFFDFHIYGPGFPYHHAFTQKRLDMGIFDGCWEEMMRRGYEPDCAMRLAFYRLRYPKGLSRKAAENYRDHLTKGSPLVLSWLIQERDCRGLSWYLDTFQPEKEALSAAVEQSRQIKLSEATALLMEHQHRRFPVGRTKTFNL